MRNSYLFLPAEDDAPKGPLNERLIAQNPPLSASENVGNGDIPPINFTLPKNT